MPATGNIFLKGLPKPVDPDGPHLRMMVVGSNHHDATSVGHACELEDFVFVAFSEVSETLIETHSPDIVLSTLFGGNFDAIDLAHKLSSSGFNGRYRAVSIGISNPEIILKEIRASVPGIDFDLFQMDNN